MKSCNIVYAELPKFTSPDKNLMESGCIVYSELPKFAQESTSPDKRSEEKEKEKEKEKRK